MTIKDKLKNIKPKRFNINEYFQEGQKLIDNAEISAKDKSIKLCNLMITFEKYLLKRNKRFAYFNYFFIIILTICAGFMYAEKNYIIFLLDAFSLVINLQTTKKIDNDIYENKMNIYKLKCLIEKIKEEKASITFKESDLKI